MKNFTRRDFINASIVGLGSALAISPLTKLMAANTAAKLPAPIGFQSWTIREALVKDFPGTLKLMASLGYQSIEMCSPPGYANAGFGPLQSLKASEMKRIITDAGLVCRSCHYGFKELQENGPERIDFAFEVGMTQMVMSSPGLPDRATLSDWKKRTDEMNVLGEQFKKQGMQLVYHNHNFEFEKLEGELIYDMILNQLDPDLVKMQFQVWVIIAGYKAADYFKKFPGRFISAHLSDWSGTNETQVPVGQGKVDWKEFFEAATMGGLKNFYVEMDMPTFEPSAKFLKTI